MEVGRGGRVEESRGWKWVDEGGLKRAWDGSG